MSRDEVFLFGRCLGGEGTQAGDTYTQKCEHSEKWIGAGELSDKLKGWCRHRIRPTFSSCLPLAHMPSVCRMSSSPHAPDHSLSLQSQFGCLLWAIQPPAYSAVQLLCTPVAPVHTCITAFSPWHRTVPCHPMQASLFTPKAG